MPKTRISPLCIGDTVALVNPAGKLPDRFKSQHRNVGDHLINLGFAVKDYVIDDGWEKASNRSDALMLAFEDKSVKAIFPICGGPGIYDVLPLLGYPSIARNPKIICGSSELSALITVITKEAGFPAFFGPHMNFLNPKASKQENQFTVRSFWNMLSWDWHGKNTLDTHEAHHFFRAPRDHGSLAIISNIYSKPELIRRSAWRDNSFHSTEQVGEFTGELLICSLSALIRLGEIGLGPSLSGKILVVDTLDMSFDEVLTLFRKMLDIYDTKNTVGITFSSVAERTDRKVRLFPELLDRKSILNFIDNASRALQGSIPVFFGLPLGHCSYKHTAPVGVRASILAESGNLILHECPFSTI